MFNTEMYVLKQAYILKIDLYQTMLAEYNHSHARIYTQNGATLCWLLSAMYGLAFCEKFRKLMIQKQNHDATDSDLSSTCLFYNILYKTQVPLLYKAFCETKKTSKPRQLIIKKGYDSILEYLQDWLKQHDVDPTDGVYRDTASALHYGGFNQEAFKKHLLKHNTVAHENFQFCVCFFCGEPQDAAVDLNTKNLIQIDKDVVGFWEIDHVITQKKQILCGDFRQAFFDCSKCKQPNLYKMFFKQPVTEIIVALERQMSNNFKLQDLRGIPLIDFKLQQHAYECTHFIRYHEHHYTLHLIDWEHEIGWTLDSLDGSRIRQVSLVEIEGFLPEAKNLFLRKTNSTPAKIMSELTHFKNINCTTQTLEKLLNVKFKRLH